MTRRDYELLTDVMTACVEEIPTNTSAATSKTVRVTLTFVAEALAARLKLDNPAFDRSRFLKACGLEADDALR